MSLYIGIDLGTSAVKLLLVDEKGTIVNEVSKEYPVYFPHSGWSEQNPEDWITAVTARPSKNPFHRVDVRRERIDSSFPPASFFKLSPMSSMP